MKDQLCYVSSYISRPGCKVRIDLSNNSVLFHNLNVAYILIFKEHDTNKHKPNGVPRLQVRHSISLQYSFINKLKIKWGSLQVFFLGGKGHLKLLSCFKLLLTLVVVDRGRFPHDV